jgi:hypothetical protein
MLLITCYTLHDLLVNWLVSYLVKKIEKRNQKIRLYLVSSIVSRKRKKNTIPFLSNYLTKVYTDNNYYK